MKDIKKIGNKIEALKAELIQAKKVEKKRRAEAVRRDIQRALANSGLLSLVTAGTFSEEQLAAEFRAVAARAEAATTQMHETR